MAKRKVLIAVHQLNLGGAQKALIAALDAIDYTENDVTLYVRKDRLDLLGLVNENVSKIIVNEDKTKYYNKPYSLLLELPIRAGKLLGRNTAALREKQLDYIVKRQYDFERCRYFADRPHFDVAVAYLQGHTAGFVDKVIDADRKIVFFHNSTDSNHALHERILPDFDRIVCVSEGARQAVAGFYPACTDRMTVIENHVDAALVREKAEEYTPVFPEGKTALCSCGRLTKEKGFDLAVEAAAVLREKGLDFRWYFVGDGPERAKLEAMIAEKDLRERIVITGLQENPYPYIQGCEIYVQPSYEEAHPLSVIEAMILQKPIVSTATVGGKNVIRDGTDGLLAAIDPASLAETIFRLAGDAALREELTKNLFAVNWEEDAARFRRQWAALLAGDL